MILSHFKKSVHLACLLMLVLAPAGNLYAAAGHGPAKLVDLTWFAINFSLFCLFAFLLIRKPFVRFWTARSDEIAAAINKGELELAQAREKFANAQAELDKLTPVYLQKIAQDIEAEGIREAQSLIAQAQQKAEQVKNQAAVTLQAEQNAAELQVRKAVGESILAQVEKAVTAAYSVEQDKQRREVALTNVRALMN